MQLLEQAAARCKLMCQPDFSWSFHTRDRISCLKTCVSI